MSRFDTFNPYRRSWLSNRRTQDYSVAHIYFTLLNIASSFHYRSQLITLGITPKIDVRFASSIIPLGIISFRIGDPDPCRRASAESASERNLQESRERARDFDDSKIGIFLAEFRADSWSSSDWNGTPIFIWGIWIASSLASYIDNLMSRRFHIIAHVLRECRQLSR